MVAFGAARLLVIENSEPALHAVLERSRSKSAAPESRAASPTSATATASSRLIAEFKPDIVFHAAALKHVPLLERDWDEGIKTNVFGSVNVADAAAAAGAAAMVMISTDKAIEPVSVLGATKRFAEMYCQALDAVRAPSRNGGRPPMRLIAVRFGNVLASNGSVVPKFKAQIEAGGPVTVTHPDMVRYFMTIREACDLVVTAASHALGRDALGVSRLRAQHGPADEDRGPRRTHDPAVRARARPRHRHRVYRHPAGRAAQRRFCSRARSRAPTIGIAGRRGGGGRSVRRSRRCASWVAKLKGGLDARATRGDLRRAARSRAGFPQ